MRNYKLTIQYDGTNFNGWQRLPEGVPTVQGALELAISQVLGYNVTIDGSGRTDAGVHAMAQVANVKTSGAVDILEFQKDINDLLPKGIYVSDIELVKNGFHSRYDATGKKYIYTVDMGDKPSVFNRKYTYHYPEKLNIEIIKESSQTLIGAHDFTSFSDNKEHKTNIRTIHDIVIKQEGNMLIFTYAGNGFLNHMVRILTGTLLDIGSGKIAPDKLTDILESKSRANAGMIVPSKGLRLEEVYY